ncbi:MAG: hypothetical protein R3208_14740 [Ketobacteraceae bacterium]|nr:hypothetical protein [Ketobacteraceae bacterium]
MNSTVIAHDGSMIAGSAKPIAPDSHAPIGVMGDHLHKQGEWMLSYRLMSMSMKDTIEGKESISPAAIATGVSNPNSPPGTMRVAPLSMDTVMHMFGLMYAPSDSLTLMAMINYTEKEMSLKTFSGMMGATELGNFETRSSGMGDIKLSALYGIIDRGNHKLHLNLGLSVPTGSTDEEDTVLTPMNTTMKMRLPYGMQLGTGTYDLQLGATYAGTTGLLGWGAQYLATTAIDDNDDGYAWGDHQALTAWASYRVATWSSLSLRATLTDADAIKGEDAEIRAPVTTADPDNYGGQRLDIAVGANLVGQLGAIRGHRLALEYTQPVDQDANGVQLEMQSMWMLGYQYAF